MKTKEKELKKENTVDKQLLAKIQPQGGISFLDEKFIKTGAGYEAVLHIYQYPKAVNDNWLTTVMNINNVVSVVDVSTESIEVVKKNINKSMREQDDRYKAAKDVTEMRDAEQKYNQLDEMYQEISAMGEVVKLIHIRLFLSEKTIFELDKKISEFINYLEGNNYKSAVFINETKPEWQAMYLTYNEQQQTEYKRYGQPILSDTLAIGNPFHFSSLIDKNGTYLGKTTSTYGAVIFDMFEVTKRRMSYNGLVIGKMGSGKSTLLKKLMLDMVARGHYIRGFDVADEYINLCEYLGGNRISLDGSDGVLNALEVLNTGGDERMCFNRHLSKLSTVYKFLSPGVDRKEVIEFEHLIEAFYNDIGLLSPIDDDLKITGLPAEKYPIWSDFLHYLEKIIDKTKSAKSKVKEEIQIDRMKRVESIRVVINNLVQAYGKIFDGHTSIDNIFNTQMVIFDIKNLSQMKSEVFDAQMFLALSLCWDNCVKVGSQMKNLYETGKISFEDVTRFSIYIDEAHRIINTNKLQAVDQLVVFEREARKYFGGLLYASQSIRDFVPEGSNQESIDKIKTLFEMATYKFIMQQDTNALEILNRVFQYQLTDGELKQIPKLQKGECILSIASDQNIQFNIDVSKQELELFRGGA